MSTILEQYRVADFLDWYRDRSLSLSPDFQRGNVWLPAARVYLIDTILRQLPIPKIYLRTSIDIKTRKSVREVVDGQQRLRAIIDFSEDRLLLTKRAGEFAGLRYSTLSSELQEVFLSYPIAVGQLINATVDDVLEVFARLNSYSVQLNDAEKRHAVFQGEFKWAVRDASTKWKVLWDEYKIASIRQRVRMLDDSLMAEMFGIILQGITDGGQTNITKLYRAFDKQFDANGPVPSNVDKVLDFFVTHFAESLRDTPLLNAPHFLMLFGALAHAIVGIPPGEIPDRDMPSRTGDLLSNLEVARDNLRILASIIERDESPDYFSDFWHASSGSTQRIASRKIRFPYLVQALLPEPL